MSTPNLLDVPIAPKYESGMLITSAHGQEAIINVSALITASLIPTPKNGRATASTIASPIMVGVYTLANFVMNFSLSAFFCDDD